jgi:transposase
MKKYIGLDVHAASTTVAVVGESGKQLKNHVVETTAGALVEQIKSITGEKYICLEEGTQSAWLYEILSPHAKEVVVSMVLERRGRKNDEEDAYKLAEQLRTGAIKKHVFKEVGGFRTLREVARVYSMIVQDSVRVQNRIKSIYRSRGVSLGGEAVYSTTGRQPLLLELPEASRTAVMFLYEQLDAVEAIRTKAEKSLVTESHKHPISRTLETCPGLGPIRVAQLLPIVVTPMRFRTKRQFWGYCGLGVVTQTSSDWVPKEGGGWVRANVNKTRGLCRARNGTLKRIFKGAATTVSTCHETDPLHRQYQRTTEAGTKPNLAKLTLARKIAAITLSMWKTKEKYDSTRHCKES